MARVLVCCHGACLHEPGYSDRWWAAIAPHTDVYGAGELGVTRFEVQWSDLLNRVGQSRLIGCVEDFLDYLYTLPTRMAILKRFTDVVRPLLAAGDTVDCLVHSMGTVVGYEGLRCFDALTLPGRVLNLITMGAALCYQWDPLDPNTAVRDHLLVANQDGARPKVASRWWNLNATGDPFGGPLLPAYNATQDFTNLPAPGCQPGQWDCSHNAYFNPANVAITRDIIAAKLNAA